MVIDEELGDLRHKVFPQIVDVFNRRIQMILVVDGDDAVVANLASFVRRAESHRRPLPAG
jgi:hypothetical protein